MRACRFCGAEFDPAPPGRRGPRPVYCTKACRQRQAEVRKKQYRRDLAATAVKADRAPWVSDKPCANCGGPIRNGKKIVRYCSAPDCRRRSQAESVARRRELNPPETHPCAWCSAPLTRATTKFCGLPECRKAAQRIRMREFYRIKGGNPYQKPEVQKAWYERRKAAGLGPKWDDARRARSQERRARKYAADAERFKPTEVYERDGWVCGICSLPVDPGLAYPHPGSPSLDHIQPLSLGGAHTRANTRLAHVRCNIVRGNRVEQESA